ncbi:MAG: hypothetical protein POH28_14145, partial [Acidocella sp.]|nr:hypothetical protein [Acidocella sp.]
MEFKRIAIDTSKHVFMIHGVDEQERPVLRRELKRGQVEAFFSKLAGTEVVLEACGGSHHWGQMFEKMGHDVRLSVSDALRPYDLALTFASGCSCRFPAPWHKFIDFCLGPSI